MVERVEVTKKVKNMQESRVGEIGQRKTVLKGGEPLSRGITPTPEKEELKFF